MGFLEIGALILTGAGTLGSVLGVFYTYASKENGKLTRAMMLDSDEKTRGLIGQGHELIRTMHLETKGLLTTIHDDNKRFHEENTRFHDENKVLLTTLVEILRKNGSRP